MDRDSETDSRLYIGLMTGTSMDGVDGVLVAIPDDYETGYLTPLATDHIPFSEDIRNLLMSLQTSHDNEIEREAMAANDLAGFYYAQCVYRLLDKACVSAEFVTAIGAHGQTVRHRPELGYSRQINNPALLAERTGIDVIADFRSRDLAAGGQGAPLVPAFHRAFFGKTGESCVIVNLGGIANISILGKNNATTGFDTGPGNILLDLWIAKHRNLLFDEDGQWAASGKPDAKLLDVMLEEAFFSFPPPKSTGRDLLNMEWIESRLSSLLEFVVLPPEDIQATLAALTATSIARAISTHAPTADRVYLCGGGARNRYLVGEIRAETARLMPGTEVATSDAIDVDPTQIEALAFAWLAHRFTHRLSGNLPEVTGAHGPRILGALYPGEIHPEGKTVSASTGNHQ